MLDDVLSLMATQLNYFIGQRFDLEEDVVQLSAPVSPDGVMPVEASDKILIFLTNINKDTLPNSHHYTSISSATVSRSDPLYLNLHVAVAANFRSARYKDALNFLSHAILCFQQTPIIDRSVQADMPPAIDKIVIDIENTEMNEASNLWGILGGKYLPSILYKVRMLCVTPEGVRSRIIPATTPDPAIGL